MKYALTSAAGRTFVDFRYHFSPRTAEFISEHPSLKPVVRAIFAPVVAVSAAVVNTTLAYKIGIVGFWCSPRWHWLCAPHLRMNRARGR
jgi:hypothetical protein